MQWQRFCRYRTLVPFDTENRDLRVRFTDLIRTYQGKWVSCEINWPTDNSREGYLVEFYNYDDALSFSGAARALSLNPADVEQIVRDRYV